MKHPPPEHGAIGEGEPPIVPKPSETISVYKIVRYVALALIIGILILNAAYFGFVLFLAFFVRIH